MRVTVGEMAEMCEELAPPEYALGGDGSGLLLGDPAAPVSRALVSVDMTGTVLAEAADRACMLIVHHPPLYRPVQYLRYDRLPGKLLLRAVGAGLAVYAAHTSLDVAPGGVNDVLAQALGLARVSVLAETGRERLYKLVVFVPHGHEDPVRDALAGAGAGHIGNYSHCTFQSEGTGTFLPEDGARPFLGTAGQLERAAEYRLETIVPASRRRRAIAAMLEAHPYEEVAYDLYPLANPGLPRGLARVGELAEPTTLAEFAARARAALDAPAVRVVGQSAKTLVTIATCAGRLAPGLLEEAAAAGADAVVVGEIKYHEAVQAAEQGMAVVELGHYASERPIVSCLVSQLEDRLRRRGADTTVAPAREQSDPIRIL